MIYKSRYGEGLACRDMAPRLLNVAYPEYPVAAGATACLGQLADAAWGLAAGALALAVSIGLRDGRFDMMD